MYSVLSIQLINFIFATDFSSPQITQINTDYFLIIVEDNKEERIPPWNSVLLCGE